MRRLAVLVESPDHVSFRYRWQAYEPALNADGWRLEHHVLSRRVSVRLRQFARLRSADAVVLARKLLPRWQAAFLRRCARRLIFDYDDAVYQRDSYAHKPYRSRRRYARFRTLVGCADVVLAGNDFLASAARRCRGDDRTIQVLPTVVDPGRYPDVDHVARGRTGNAQLVWIGSASTAQGFTRAEELFETIGRRLPGLALRVIADSFPHLQHLDVLRCPWTSKTELSDLCQGDVGVSWLPDDAWSRGKCGLKVLQYLAAGLPVVVNPVGVQDAFVRESLAGRSAQTASEWIDTLSELVGDPSLRARMGRAGRQYVAERYSPAAWTPTLLDRLNALPSSKKPSEARSFRAVGRSLARQICIAKNSSAY